MNCEPIQRWANQAANTAGKMLDQGKDLFHSARDRAWDAGERARKAHRGDIHRAEAYLAGLQDRWHDLVSGARSRLSHAGDSFGDRLHSTERMLLKVGGLFLVFKCFSNRNKQVSEVAASARAHIEEQPIGSAVIALGIGYALGKLLR